MAVDAFLKLDDLKGESVVQDFEDQIQVLSWNWGMSQMGTTHRGTGGGAGKVDVQDMTITHYVDTASPSLIRACCHGDHFDEAVLSVRKAGGDALPYLIITMNEVIVTSLSTGGAEGEELIIENVTLNFAKFEMLYQPQDNKGGKAGGAVTVEYDIAKNV